MTATRVLFATLWFVAVANLAGAAQIDFDPATLPNLSASALVTAPVSQPANTMTTTLLPNYTPLNVTYDLGNDATASVQEGDLAGSGTAFVTYDGDGTNQITVRIIGEGLASGTPPTGGGSTRGAAVSTSICSPGSTTSRQGSSIRSSTSGASMPRRAPHCSTPVLPPPRGT